MYGKRWGCLICCVLMLTGCAVSSEDMDVSGSAASEPTGISEAVEVTETVQSSDGTISDAYAQSTETADAQSTEVGESVRNLEAVKAVEMDLDADYFDQKLSTVFLTQLFMWGDNLYLATKDEEWTVNLFYRYNIAEDAVYYVGQTPQYLVSSGDLEWANDGIYFCYTQIGENEDFTNMNPINQLWKIDILKDEIQLVNETETFNTLVYMTAIGGNIYIHRGVVRDDNMGISIIDVYDTRNEELHESLIEKSVDRITLEGQVLQAVTQYQGELYLLMSECVEDGERDFIEIYSPEGEYLRTIDLGSSYRGENMVVDFVVMNHYAYVRLFSGGNYLLDIAKDTDQLLMKWSEDDGCRMIHSMGENNQTAYILEHGENEEKVWKFLPYEDALYEADLPFEEICTITMNEQGKVIFWLDTNEGYIGESARIPVKGENVLGQ